MLHDTRRAHPSQESLFSYIDILEYIGVGLEYLQIFRRFKLFC